MCGALHTRSDLSRSSHLIVDSGGQAFHCSLPILDNCDPSEVNSQKWSINISNRSFASTGSSILNETRAQYCLSSRVEERCKLRFSLAIMVVVIIFDLI